jgi:hypothetical protein
MINIYIYITTREHNMPAPVIAKDDTNVPYARLYIYIYRLLICRMDQYVPYLRIILYCCAMQRLESQSVCLWV